MNLKRSSYYYEEKGDDFKKRLLSSMHKISRKHPRYGYRRMYDKLRKLGWKVKKKRIQRLMRK